MPVMRSRSLPTLCVLFAAGAGSLKATAAWLPCLLPSRRILPVGVLVGSWWGPGGDQVGIWWGPAAAAGGELPGSGFSGGACAGEDG